MKLNPSDLDEAYHNLSSRARERILFKYGFKPSGDAVITSVELMVKMLMVLELSNSSSGTLNTTVKNSNELLTRANNVLEEIRCVLLEDIRSDIGGLTLLEGLVQELRLLRSEGKFVCLEPSTN